MAAVGKIEHSQGWVRQRLDADQKQCERLDDREEAEHRRYAQHSRHLPADRLRADRRIVIGDRHDRDVVQQRHDHDHHGGERLKAEDDARQHDKEHDVHRQRDTINRIAGDAAEDPPRFVDGVVDDRQPRRGEDQRRGSARGVGRTGHRGAAVGLLQRRGVVDAVPGHGDQMAARLQRLHDRIFVFGEHPGEAIRPFDRIDDLRRHIVRIHALREGVGRRDDMRSHAELARRFAGDRRVIAGDHLHPHALGGDEIDRLLGIVARGVEHRQNAEQRPGRAVVLGTGDRKRPIASRGEIVDGLLHAVGDVLCRLDEIDNRRRRPLGHDERLALRAGHGRGRALGHRVEGDILALLVSAKDGLILQRLDHRGVDRIAVFDLGGERAGENHVLRIFGGNQNRVAELELVLCQRAGLVGAQDVDARHLLDRLQPRDDRLALRQGERAERHRDGEHRRHRHRNRGDQQNQDELQDIERVAQAPRIGDDDVLIDAERHHDRRQHHGDDDEKIPDLKHRLLRMADRAGPRHELCRAAEERIRASRDDDPFHLALLDDASGKGLVADLLGDGKRLAGQRRLVDRGKVAGHHAQIGGNDDAEADFHDVAGHERCGIDHAPFAVAQRRGFRRQAFFQGGQRIRRLQVLP